MSVVALQTPEKPKEPIGRLKTGDAVVLRGQRLVMTVRSVERRKAVADWHSDAGDWCTADFPVAMLERAANEPETEGGEDAESPE